MTHRTQVESWRRPGVLDYRFRKAELDVLPLGTYLIDSEIGTGGYPERIASLAQGDPRKIPGVEFTQYAQLGATMTGAGRTLDLFWANGHTVSKRWVLYDIMSVRYIIQPGDDGHDLLVAFEMACITRHRVAGKSIPHAPTVMLRALGLSDQFRAFQG